MKPQHPELPFRDFFAGLTEFAFESKLGVADPPLVEICHLPPGPAKDRTYTSRLPDSSDM
jgi:hypothetical protein